VNSLPLLPYSSMIANCFLWLTYGVLIQESKIWFTNLVGLILAVFYFIRFTKVAPAKSPSLPGSVRQHWQACLSVVGVTMMWIALCYLTVRRKGMWMAYAAATIGNVAVLFCLLMFASPLSALRTVIQTKSAKSIPLPYSMATCLNCFLWSVAGLGEFGDFNIYFPNLLGLTCGLFQVALKIIYGNGGPTSTMTKAEAEVELSL
jgi:solute carrier family 50 protein (sugar transporter)